MRQLRIELINRALMIPDFFPASDSARETRFWIRVFRASVNGRLSPADEQRVILEHMRPKSETGPERHARVRAGWPANSRSLTVTSVGRSRAANLRSGALTPLRPRWLGERSA